MRSYRPQTGPFKEGNFFSKDEIERICTDELRKENLLPDHPGATRIDRFIEKRFVTPTYQDLGVGILGFTRFGTNGVQEIVVNSRLEGEGSTSADRRIRTTLAHEGGHCLLHTHLFVLSGSQSPLLDGQDTPKILCRDELDSPNQKTYRGEWWEYQANRAIGSLLMPRHLVEEAIAPFLEEAGHLGFKVLTESTRSAAETALSELFDVNRVVARIRIEELYSKSNATQGVL